MFLNCPEFIVYINICYKNSAKQYATLPHRKKLIKDQGERNLYEIRKKALLLRMSYFNILLIGYYCQTMNIFNWCVFKNSVYLCILLTPKLFDTLFFFLQLVL